MNLPSWSMPFETAVQTRFRNVVFPDPRKSVGMMRRIRSVIDVMEVGLVSDLVCHYLQALGLAGSFTPAQSNAPDYRLYHRTVAKIQAVTPWSQSIAFPMD